MIRVGYMLLIFLLILVSIWFFHQSSKYKAYYRTAFLTVMILAFYVYLSKAIFRLIDDFGYMNDSFLLLERLVYILLLVVISTVFAIFLFCLIDQFHYFSKWKKFLFILPCIVAVLAILTTPFTGYVLYVQDNAVRHGALYPFIVAVIIFYGSYSSLHAYSRRRLLPKIFGQCVLLVMIFTLIEYAIYLLSHETSLVSAAIVIDIVIYLLALTNVEYYKDHITKLLNRAAFEQYVMREIGRGNESTVYLIKLKNYYYLKDSCHEIPLYDAVKELAECIKKYSMLSSVYYLGDGKYVIIVPKKAHFSEEKFFEQLQERFCVPFDVNGASIQLSLFIAIMHLQGGKINKDNFTKYFIACDEMKYRSNELLEIIQGDSFGIDQLQRYHQVEEAIERALIENEFKVFYQPIVSAKTKKIVSCEALLRLNDRVLGFISPEEFIPISESNGKIIAISDYVIDSVFQFVKENDLEKMGIEFVEVNLSMIQCMDRNLPNKLRMFLEKYGIEPRFINLEITETATNYDEERLKQQLSDIKQLGFSFSLDDYGTGYSNLVRVLEYPVDMIKLDKSIVWSAFHVEDNFITMKNLISMFHDVRRKIVAEGVESEEQMASLCDLQCDYLQGYYYSKPICEEDFLKFLNKFNASK